MCATIAAIPHQLGGRPECPRGSRRDLHAGVGFRGAEPPSDGGGGEAVREPAQHRAGSVRQKDPDKTAERNLSIWIYQLGHNVGLPTSHRIQSRSVPRGSGPADQPDSKRVEGIDAVEEYVKTPLSASRPRLRNRRRGSQGGSACRPGSCRLHGQSAAMGDRIQAAARREDHDPDRTSRSTSGAPARLPRMQCSTRSL